MIIPIKETLMRFLNKRIAKKNMLERVNPSFSSSRKIGVVFSWEGEEKKEVIDEFVKVMDLAGKDITIACFFKNTKEIKKDNDVLTFTRGDNNLFGRIKSDDLNKFTQIKFDFLFHLDTYDNVFIENILARTQASCRVGRFDDNRKEYYDFMIDIGNDMEIEKLCSEILKYTKLIVAYD